MKHKKLFKALFAIVMVACLAFGAMFALAGCEIKVQENKGDPGVAGQDGKDGKDGANGKDGVTPHIGSDGYWYFGDEKTDYKATGTDGKSAYELYLEQYKTEHDGQSEGAMSESEWLESLKAKNVGWLTGMGDPTEDFGAENDFYLDTASGNIWQKSSAWSKKGSFADLSGSYIEKIYYGSRSWGIGEFKWTNGVYTVRNSEAGTWKDDRASESIKGYWLVFADKSGLFIQMECNHLNVDGQNPPITLYTDDCTFGTVQIRKCAFCGETVTKMTDPTRTPTHRYSEEWTFDEENHWHEAVCVHKEDLGHKDENAHTWRTYYTVDYDETSGSVKGYIKWQECRVCGYIINSKLSDPASLVSSEDQKVHIHDAEEWEMFAKAVNSGATYGENKKFAEAEVELDADINFGGLTIDPIGLPSNASEVTDRSNTIYLDLKKEAVIKGGFKGRFNGNGHKLSNFKIDGGNFTGLFGYVDGATITNFTVEKSGVTGDAFVGAVAGFITGTGVRISKVTVIDTKVMGYAHIGGIAGYAKDAGPAMTTATASSDAAIKNCTVKATEEVQRPDPTNANTMYIIAAHSIQDPTDKLYFDGTCGGGILGTSHSSSVIGCFNDNVNVMVTLGAARIVGVADGTETAKSIVVGNNIHWSLATSKNYCDKAGNKLGHGRATDFKIMSEFYKSTMDYDNGLGHGDDYARYATGRSAYVYKSNNQRGDTAPYAISTTGCKMRVAPQADGDVLEIGNVGELFEFAENVMYFDYFYTNYTIKLTDNIIFGEDDTWTPIDKFQPENDPLKNAVFDGQGHKIINLHTDKQSTTPYPYGVAMFGVITGTFTVQNVTFDDAHMHFIEGDYYGNVAAVVVGYAYGDLTFKNVTVTNSHVWGYGKVGALLGMGADPNVHITFDGCTSENNILHGAYNVGGFAGNIQRAADGTDNTVFVEDSGNLSKGNTYDLNQTEFDLDVEANFLMNDRTGTTYLQKVEGVYVEVGAPGYLYGGYAEYYISYGSSSYDPRITTEGYTNYRIANSEICMNEAKTFEHGDTPVVSEA